MIATIVGIGASVVGLVGLFAGIRIVNQTERALVLRLGKHKKEVESGFNWKHSNIIKLVLFCCLVIALIHFMCLWIKFQSPVNTILFKFVQ